MCSQKIVEIRLDGSIPSKKNSRVNTRDGRSFPSRQHEQWQKDALRQVRMQTRERFRCLTQIEIIVYFATLGRADLDNKCTSIYDMLVDGLVLKDDYWETVTRQVHEAAYRPGNPGAFIRITPLPDDFLGSEYLDAAAKRDRRKKRK